MLLLVSGMYMTVRGTCFAQSYPGAIVETLVKSLEGALNSLMTMFKRTKLWCHASHVDRPFHINRFGIATESPLLLSTMSLGHVWIAARRTLTRLEDVSGIFVPRASWQKWPLLGLRVSLRSRPEHIWVSTLTLPLVIVLLHRIKENVVSPQQHRDVIIWLQETQR